MPREDDAKLVDKQPSGIHGHGMGTGEVTVDKAGEGDGCDRCGCPDEEMCCPGFWNDPGVPGIFPLSWAFDPKNKWLNDNHVARIFGNFGFKFFDKERKAFMGTALAVTVFAIVITGFGCFALSGDDSIVRLTAWGIAHSRHTASDGSEVGQISYIGLRKFVVYSCLDASAGTDFYAWKECTYESRWWSHVECKSGADDYYGFDCDAAEECQETTAASQFGAFTTAATLIFAMIGCLTRIRKVADTNFQKFIGCIPDTIGVITQTQALVAFASGCYDTMPTRAADGSRIHYVVGAGYWAYVFCVAAALVRVTMHYLTPVPGGGAGCHCTDMKVLLDAAAEGLVDASNAAAAATAIASKKATELAGVADKKPGTGKDAPESNV